MRTPYPFASHCFCLAPTVVLLCFVHACIGSEHDVFVYFSNIRAVYPALTKLVELVSNGSLFLFYPVYAFFLFRGIRTKKADDVLFALCYIAAQLLVAALLCRVVKIAVGRPRPMTGGAFVPFSFGWGYQSFPSGHTGEALGSCLPFVWRFATIAPQILPLSFGVVLAVVAYTRLHLGMHHPTDIWGGLVFGSLSGYVSWTFFNALRSQWRRFLPSRLQNWLNLA